MLTHNPIRKWEKKQKKNGLNHTKSPYTHHTERKKKHGEELNDAVKSQLKQPKTMTRVAQKQ